MLSTITRSSYICAQCRYRILRNVAPRPLRLSLIANSRRNNSTFLARGYREPKPKRGGVIEEEMDSLVDSFIESAFSNTSLPPRPAPGIGKADHGHRVLQALPATWEEAGVRPVVAEALLNAYPNTTRPTEIQKRILYGLKSQNSMAVRDLPGTGKSFAIAAWALGLERAMKRGSTGKLLPTTTAFIFVPDSDLGIQYYLMIKNLLQASSSQAVSSSLDSFVQLLHRGEKTEWQRQIELLSQRPNPHIIITTPAASLDILSDKSDSINGLLDFSRATAFVLDEFDALAPRVHLTDPPKQHRILPLRGPNSQSPQDSRVEKLLDWVFKMRKAEALEQEVDVIQPQLVLSSATLSTSRMIKFTQFTHPQWIGHPEKNSPTSVVNLYDLPKASHLLAIGDESSGVDKIVRAVADNIVHHAVAYDVSSGFMRNAPIPRIELWTSEEITQKLGELKVYEENAESKHQANTVKKEGNSLISTPLESWDLSNSRAKRAGYPPEIAAEALKKLLEHDKWPKNAIAAIGQEAGVRLFITECAKQGIKARELTVSNWNRDMEKEGRIPIGRTDMLFDPKIRKYYKERNERDSSQDETIVWVTTSTKARGLDIPGVFHLYVLHRLVKARDYTTYCGRVARWPFPTLEQDTKDPGSLGLTVRRGVGKVVSLLLEDHVVPASGLENSSAGNQIITNDGSDRAKWSWLEEGLMLAKIGCHFQDYYGNKGEYPCGPEVPTPKLIKPKALPPIASPTFNLLDAALGPGPLQESSLFSPSEESPSDQTRRDPFELSPERPKQASKTAQHELSTDLPDLADMWNLPLPDVSSKPRKGLQEPTRNSGDDASFWATLKDPTPPSQTLKNLDPSFFTPPQENFRTESRSSPARKWGATRLSARGILSDNGYLEPLTKSLRGKNCGPGQSKDLERYDNPREEFRPDLKSDKEREEDAKMLSLTAVDAEEGYQVPFAPEYNHARSRESDEYWNNPRVEFVPFKEVGSGKSGKESADELEFEEEVEKVRKPKSKKNKGQKAEKAAARAQTAVVEATTTKAGKKAAKKAAKETAAKEKAQKEKAQKEAKEVEKGVEKEVEKEVGGEVREPKRTKNRAQKAEGAAAKAQTAVVEATTTKAGKKAAKKAAKETAAKEKAQKEAAVEAATNKATKKEENERTQEQLDTALKKRKTQTDKELRLLILKHSEAREREHMSKASDITEKDT